MDVITKCPKTGKRSFETEQQAVDFERKNREQYGNPEQFAYPCQDCPQWHLSTSPPGNDRIARVHYPVVPDTETSISNGRPGRPTKLVTAEIVQLKESGMTIKELAEKFDVTTAAITYHLYKKDNEEPPQLITYEQHRDRRLQLEEEIHKLQMQFEAEVHKLQEEIRRVKTIEDRLFEQRQLKIGYAPDGVVLSKNGREFNLTKEELEKLLAEMNKS